MTDFGLDPKIVKYVDSKRFSGLFGGVRALPIKILKGPRQVGKTSILSKLKGYRTVFFDDLAVRTFAQESPREFLEQLQGPLILDEATLAPNLFPELKRRVDQERLGRDGFPREESGIDIWITGSNQTLLQKNVRESLAGRASYFDLNTLSIHEIPNWALETSFMKGGWPELIVSPGMDPARYLNDLIFAFIEKDIVAAAGIEKRAAFSRSLSMLAGRVGQLLNASEIAQTVGVDVTTVQSWISLLEQNGLLRVLRPFHSNINLRLTKSPKVFFEDTGLAVRLQGWSEFLPIVASPSYGPLLENLVVSEFSKFSSNCGLDLKLFFVRSKDKVEIDLLIELPNQRYIAAKVKSSAQSWTSDQHRLVDSLKINIVEKWMISLNGAVVGSPQVRSVGVQEIFENLKRLCTSTF